MDHNALIRKITWQEFEKVGIQPTELELQEATTAVLEGLDNEVINLMQTLPEEDSQLLRVVMGLVRIHAFHHIDTSFV
jgi:hypothetical protein